MKLLTKELEKRFAQVGRQEENPLIIAKFFTPRTSWTWYATEYDPDNGIFFGYVVGHEKERWYFSLYEMLAIQWPYGLRIERGLRFEEVFFNDLKL